MHFYRLLITAIFTMLTATGPSIAADTVARAHYLANEGVLITHGDVKVIFDPLFDESYGQYQLVPKKMEQDLFAGVAPFDGIDAVFVSHHHGDHFAPAAMLSFLKARDAIKFYAPAQAVAALRSIASAEDEAVFERVTAFSMENGSEPQTITVGNLLIEAVRIPHSGWPTRFSDVENIAFRVTLADGVSVLHFGDADPDPAHFADHAGHWDGHEPTLALPPYWFFVSEGGQLILEQYIGAEHAIGIHVPVSMPDDPASRPAEIQGFDLFTEPGEIRELGTKH